MSLWSPQETEWLEAMGLQVLQAVSPGHVAALPDSAAVSRSAASTATPGERLHRALRHALRACADPDAALAALQLDIDTLRNDPAGKRALWPRLRALRSASP